MDSSTLALAVIAIIILAILLDSDAGTILIAAALVFAVAALWQRSGSKEGLESKPRVCGAKEGLVSAPRACGGSKERFASSPQKEFASEVWTPDPAPHKRVPDDYLGAFDTTFDADSLQFGSYRDRQEVDNDYFPFGNPFVASRSFAPAGGPACFDDEANNEEYDADERITYQARARNDPIRATIGSMNRLKDFGPYVKEELQEEEEKRWWGRHEY